MAEALLREMLREKNCHVSSAGLFALVNYPPAVYAAEVMLEKKGIDISAHRARQATREMFLASDLILVMENRQKNQIEFDLPVVCGRVLRVGQWRGTDIPDPYRRPKIIFEQTLLLLDECLTAWSNRL